MNRTIVLLSSEPITWENGAYTKPQADLYNFLLDQTQAGLPPSVAQMAIAMGYDSPAPVESCLQHLQRRGVIEIHQPEPILSAA